MRRFWWNFIKLSPYLMFFLLAVQFGMFRDPFAVLSFLFFTGFATSVGEWIGEQRERGIEQTFNPTPTD